MYFCTNRGIFEPGDLIMGDISQNDTDDLVNIFKKKTTSNVIRKEHKAMPGGMLKMAGNIVRSNNTNGGMMRELFGSDESADSSENGMEVDGDAALEEIFENEFGKGANQFTGSSFYPGSRSNIARQSDGEHEDSMAEEVDDEEAQEENSTSTRGKKKGRKGAERQDAGMIPNLMQQQKRISFSDVRKHVVFGTPLNQKPKNQTTLDDSFTINNRNSSGSLSSLLMPPPPPPPQQQENTSQSGGTISGILGSFSKQINEARTNMKEEKTKCWMCAFASRKEGSIKRGPLDIFFDIFSMCYKRGTNEEVAHIMANYYYEKIYKVLLKKKKKVPMLTAEEIQRHIEHHMLDSRVFIAETLEDLKIIRHIIKQNVFQRKESPDGLGGDDELPETDNRNAKAFAEISKLMLTFYKEDPSKWKIFNNDEYNFDLQNRSGLFNAVKNTKE